jgi:hypothetical protein
VFGRTITQGSLNYGRPSTKKKSERAQRGALRRAETGNAAKEISPLRGVIGGLFRQFAPSVVTSGDRYWPVLGDRRGFARLSSAGAIDDADRLGFEFDSELLNDMIDGVFVGWNSMMRSYWRVVSSRSHVPCYDCNGYLSRPIFVKRMGPLLDAEIHWNS